MARKSRSRQRREAAALPVAKVARPAPPPAQRGTFRVSQALQQAAADLPGIVRNRQAERRAAAPRRSAPLDPLPATVAQGEAKRSPRQAMQRNTPAQPSLRDAPKSGVCRPRGGPKSGGGSGRSFVPFKDC